MRQEIKDAIAIAHRLKITQQRWTTHDVPAEISSGNYSSRLSYAQQHNLQQVFNNIRSLQQCVKTSALITTVEPSTTTSLEVYADNQATYVVIECSVYGMLAALFIYGVISSELIDHVKQCIQEQGLTLITDKERGDLEKQSLYQELF